ncbi:SPX domain-containing protein 3 [Ranunculus cassubicifolius]
MKFGKRLKDQIQQTLPEWRNKFLCYKDLKKLVRLSVGKPESEFEYLLNMEIEKFNSFFMEQEEDFIIRHSELQQRIQRASTTWGAEGCEPSESDYKEEMGSIRKEIINFHGEMVLLVNYSNINYTGLAKILKKYDKRTGALLRLPFIQKVLEQPFFTTDLVSKLIKECETTIDRMFPKVEKKENIEEDKGETNTETTTNDGRSILRNTVAALETMQEMRRKSSTYSHFSLPPLTIPDRDTVQCMSPNILIPIP